jgi:hypothetical protein
MITLRPVFDQIIAPEGSSSDVFLAMESDPFFPDIDRDQLSVRVE